MKPSRSLVLVSTHSLRLCQEWGFLPWLLRIRKNTDAPRSQFEKTALRITGFSFYLLTAGLGITAVYNLFTAHKPETTLPGLIISTVSIAIMWLLVVGKRKVGHALNSTPILADANCTMVCIYMSIVLLVSKSRLSIHRVWFYRQPWRNRLDLFFDK